MDLLRVDSLPGPLTSEGGAYAFGISERNNVAATGKACIVM